MKTIEIKRGKVFLKEGDQGSDAYFIISGKMEVYVVKRMWTVN